MFYRDECYWFEENWFINIMAKISKIICTNKARGAEFETDQTVIHILGEIKDEWMNYNIISTNFKSNIVQKQSKVLQFFPKLLNQTVSMRFEYNFQIKTTTELFL